MFTRGQVKSAASDNKC